MKLNKVTFNDTVVYVNGKEAGYYEKFGDTYVFYEKYSFNHNMTSFQPHSEYAGGVDYDSLYDMEDDLQTLDLIEGD